MTVQCCKCRKLKIDGEWTRASKPPEGCVSHTYCPVCLAQVLAEIRSEHEEPIGADGDETCLVETGFRTAVSL